MAQYNTEGLANIVSLGLMIKKGHRITMDTDIEKCINLHDEGAITKFTLTKEGLFAFKPSENYRKEIAKKKAGKNNYMAAQEVSNKIKKSRHIVWDDDDNTVTTEPLSDYSDASDDESYKDSANLITEKESDNKWESNPQPSVAKTEILPEAESESDLDPLQLISINADSLQLFDVDTVKDNMKNYTSRQVRHAKRARELQVSIGCTTDFLKALLQQPGTPIEANPVKLEHVKISEDIFGKDVSALKGKTTRRQPGAVIDDSVYIPEEIYTKHPNIKLEIDVMYINGLTTLTGIDTTVIQRNFQTH